MIRIRSKTPTIASLVTFAALTFAPSAFADALPPNDCGSNATVGSACTSAGPSFDQDGTCQNETCTGSVHLPDGGFQTNSYPCILCELSDGGAADSGPSTDSGPSADSGPPDTDAGADAGPPPAPDAGPSTNDAGSDAGPEANRLASSSGCSVAIAGAPLGASYLFALGAVGAVVTTLARRRRKG
jgi:hypothetical protein